MPIPPYVTFADLKKANDNDHRVIPFTGVDYASGNGFEAALAEDVRQGARGMKLHPIIQREPLNGQRTFDAVEAFAVHGLPVLFHCGVSSYYLKPDRDVLENPALGWISDAKELVAAFPNVTFIAGHAGLMEYREVIALLSGYRNVRVDTSFHSPARVRKLIDAFGPERVMYASDWPYGNMMPAIRIIEKACRGDRGLERRLFYENAAEVLGVG
jgi:predicted TIM-barrel fold metal-dependent hydrolase